MLVKAESVEQLDELTRPWRAAGQRIALVPTMGNLHEGHLSLCTRAAQMADRVVATIFVNPTQFGVNEDFDSYPRTLDDDLDALRHAGNVDAVFAPDVDAVYPHGTSEAARIGMPPLSRQLCGASRPGHFDGVAGVVLRLLNLTSPDLLILGEKDYQQLVLLRWLIRDLRLRVEIAGAPIFRADDGLALSSRNRYLDAGQRARAPLLFRELTAVAEAIRAGGRRFAELQAQAIDALSGHGFDVDYVEVRAAEDLRSAESGDAAEALIVLGAAKIGAARLIDNVRV